MKHIKFIIAVAVLLTSCATTRTPNNGKTVVVYNPIHRDHHRLAVTKVEITPKETIIKFNVNYEPNKWVEFDRISYLEVGRKRYMIRSIDGWEIEKKFYMPESGEAEFTVHFAPIPAKTKKFSFRERGGWRVADIELYNRKVIY